MYDTERQALDEAFARALWHAATLIAVLIIAADAAVEEFLLERVGSRVLDGVPAEVARCGDVFGDVVDEKNLLGGNAG